jgi:hypothetical protein
VKGIEETSLHSDAIEIREGALGNRPPIDTEAGTAIKDAVARYATEVRDGSFPGEGKSFGMKEEVLKRLYGT